MPIVEVNGQELEFPDDMGQDEIKSILQKKFPTSAKPSLAQDIGNIAARTGRIATGIAGATADLPVTVGQSAYDATRAIQSKLGTQVAPKYKIPLPSEGLKGIYDIATGGAGKATGTAATLDKLAEIGAPLTGLATKVVPEVAKLAIPRVKGVTNQLAQRATEFGIPLRLDQVVPSRAMNTAQKISQEIPLSGVDASEATQLQSWNKNIARTIGQDADNLGPEVIQKFKADAHTKFNSALSDANIMIDTKDIDRLKQIKKVAPESVGTNSLSVVNSNINRALKDIKAGGMSGDKLANIRTSFMENLSTADGGAKKFIGKIIDTIDDIAERSVTPQKAQELSIARREWRNFKTIEPLLEKSVDGNINPTELLNRIKANKYIKASTKKIGDDDLVDLARIGKQFLAKKGGSDTFQKTVAGVGLGGMGTLLATNPILAAQTLLAAGTGVAANRGLQALNQSPSMVQAALTGRNFNPNISNALAAISSGAIMNRGE